MSSDAESSRRPGRFVMLVGLVLACGAVGVLAALGLRSCSSDSPSPSTAAPSSSVPSFFRQDAHLTCFSNGSTEAINIGLATWRGLVHWVDASGAQVGVPQRVDAASGAIGTPRGATKAILDLQATDVGETQTLRLTADCT